MLAIKAIVLTYGTPVSETARTLTPPEIPSLMYNSPESPKANPVKILKQADVPTPSDIWPFAQVELPAKTVFVPVVPTRIIVLDPSAT